MITLEKLIQIKWFSNAVRSFLRSRIFQIPEEGSLLPQKFSMKIDNFLLCGQSIMSQSVS